MKTLTPGQIPDSIRRVFVETFTARDIVEPLTSFDFGDRSANVRGWMEATRQDIVGVRSEGRLVGYVRRESLGEGDCGETCLPFDGMPLLEDSSPLLEVLRELKNTSVVFISRDGSIGGMVTRADLQKPPVRMWLFGLVTLIEMRFTELIGRHCPDDTWRKYISETRLQKAEALLSERRRRSQSLRLIDCLQLGDKGQIVARDAEIRQETIFGSRRQAEEATKMVERLRNNLAHAQDIVSSDWDTIVLLTEFVMQRFGPMGCSISTRR
jgi:hypothetical protein